MLRVEKTGKRLVSFAGLKPKPLAEFYDLADFIVNSPEEFFGEIGEKAFLIGAHIDGPPRADAAADLVAVDGDGASVIIVVRNPGESSPLSRAMSAAGRFSTWTAEDFYRSMRPERVAELKTFLGANLKKINQRQRILLIAEEFAAELLTTASWLTKQYGMDIVCVEVALGAESVSGAEYLSCRVAKLGEAASSPAPRESAEQLERRPTGREWTAGERPPLIRDDELERTEQPERRSSVRGREFQSARVRIEYSGRQMGARLVDYSDGGLGVEMHNPLPIGSDVKVNAEIEQESATSRLRGPARVAHCKFAEEFGFRMGLAFGEVERSTEPKK